MPTQGIVEALDRYDAWLAGHCEVIPAELARKRRMMASDPFVLLRGTAFRYAARFAAAEPALTAALRVPSCGDAHIENFGTWRDAEGRLVWGVNDLDEAAMLPWTADLLRLAASALLARQGKAPRAREVAATILEGYCGKLAAPCAFVLDARHAALRAFVAPAGPARAKFWAMIEGLREATPPAAFDAALREALPPGASGIRFAPRTAGVGSLGRPRFVCAAEWGGSPVAREAKARVPSAWIEAGFPGALGVDALAFPPPGRVPDPWFRQSATLSVRRLAPDSRKLEAPEGEPAALLQVLGAMAAELANLHAAGGAVAAVAAEAKALPRDWLREAAKREAAANARDAEALR
ncbi:DUF2252 family protein [Paracraurococcus lichenis]|uniref:DUF2252 family protein n=1 Tax=Paracraurococcus lichenis TaxID=3064888 RepID=A0ABT9DWE0_9PROT|nr:DUF2252 family protein [Paracraurococcus sp. LOR1-02]MDO9708209.1 DUF2252 family protein [Paracraurococcus sp. LOR1-02]